MNPKKVPTPKPPKEIWVNVYGWQPPVVHLSAKDAADGNPVDGITAHYRLVTPKREPREAVGWVIRHGDVKGQGAYAAGDGTRTVSYPSSAFVFRDNVSSVYPDGHAWAKAHRDQCHGGARIVKLVRKVKP